MRLRELLDFVTVAGPVRSKHGTVIHVSSNGTTSVGGAELDRIVEERFRAMRTPPAKVNGHDDLAHAAE